MADAIERVKAKAYVDEPAELNCMGEPIDHAKVRAINKNWAESMADEDNE